MKSITFRNKYGRFTIEIRRDYDTIKPHESMQYPDYLQNGRTHRIVNHSVTDYMNNLNLYFKTYFTKDIKNETK